MPIKIVLGLQFLYSIVKFIQGIFQSFFIVARYNPDICIGFGSYASLGIVFAAYLNKIPTIIHEQNVKPGKANRFLSYFVNKILLSFPKSRDYFKKDKKIELVGNPLRLDLRKVDLLKAKSHFGFKQDAFVLLVTGGSQGSSKINSIFIKSLVLLPKELKDNLAIIHIAGEKQRLLVENRYRQFSFNARVYGFFEDMSFVYSASDLAISRSGAMTVAELSFFGLPAILIPYPFAGAHQVLNAKCLADSSKVVLLEEANFCPSCLAEAITGLFFNRDKTQARKADDDIVNSSAVKIAVSLNKLYKENQS